MHRKKKLFVDKVEEINFCGNQMFQFTGGEYEVPFPVKPTECAHNFENCENCRKHHELLMKEIKPLTDKFPFCCEAHSKLTEFPDFKIEDYKNLEQEIADKVYFTHHHIIDRIDNEDWYEDITDYIWYVTESFGTLPPEFGGSFQLGSYYEYVLELIRTIENIITSDKISKREIQVRIEKIKNFINSFRKENSEKKNTDLNLLLSTYDKWFKIFPFELSYFDNIRERYRSNIPILAEPFHLNRYTKVKVAKLHTKESLTQSLINTTKKIISQINGATLLKKGLFTDAEKIEYDLIIQQREMELRDIELMENSKQSAYLKVLRNWFKGEKKFIKEITPYLKKQSSQTKASYNRTDLAYYIYYLYNSGYNILENRFPSDAAWKELGEKHGKNWKNIQSKYNEICNSKEERLKKDRKRNIEKVISSLLKDYPKAESLAKDELKMVELNS